MVANRGDNHSFSASGQRRYQVPVRPSRAQGRRRQGERVQVAVDRADDLRHSAAAAGHSAVVRGYQCVSWTKWMLKSLELLIWFFVSQFNSRTNAGGVCLRDGGQREQGAVGLDRAVSVGAEAQPEPVHDAAARFGGRERQRWLQQVPGCVFLRALQQIAGRAWTGTARAAA